MTTDPAQGQPIARGISAFCNVGAHEGCHKVDTCACSCHSERVPCFHAREVEAWKARYEQVRAERDTLRDDIRFMERFIDSAKPVVCYECATCKRIYRTAQQVWECRHG